MFCSEFIGSFIPTSLVLLNWDILISPLKLAGISNSASLLLNLLQFPVTVFVLLIIQLIPGRREGWKSIYAPQDI